MYKIIIPSAILLFSLVSCGDSDPDYDATGSFQCEERIISAEATGKILRLDITEGQRLTAGQTVGQIDPTALVLQEEQMQASIQAIGQKTTEAGPQIEVLRSQLSSQQSQTATLQQQIKVLDKEITRFENLVAADAVPRKQLDDLLGQKSVLQKQLQAAQTQTQVTRAQMQSAQQSVDIQNRAVTSEVTPNQKRLDLIRKQIKDATITNDVAGTVTSQLAYEGEFTAIGKPLYKIANLADIYLMAYISGDQLAQVSIGQKVRVFTDDGEGGYAEGEGTIRWISDQAEFTPKTIQTKDERANLVYAIKISTPNDGRYKIGMYGQVLFN